MAILQDELGNSVCFLAERTKVSVSRLLPAYIMNTNCLLADKKATQEPVLLGVVHARI